MKMRWMKQLDEPVFGLVFGNIEQASFLFQKALYMVAERGRVDPQGSFVDEWTVLVSFWLGSVENAPLQLLVVVWNHPWC